MCMIIIIIHICVLQEWIDTQLIHTTHNFITVELFCCSFVFYFHSWHLKFRNIQYWSTAWNKFFIYLFFFFHIFIFENKGKIRTGDL